MSWALYYANDPADRLAWIRQWEEWPDREVAAHPDYVQLFVQPGEVAACATWESRDCHVLFPFILRGLNQLPWGSHLEGMDLESPYGYGGPFSWGVAGGPVPDFWAAFDEWAASAGIVSAFARLTLFPDDLFPLLRGEVKVVQKNVVRDLRLDDASLLRDYAHKVRKNINRALRSGVHVEFDQDGARLEEFIAVYNSTMDRRAAADRYRFGPQFFDRLCRSLRGEFVFAHALADGEVVSAELVLLSASRAYSFLGGTLQEAFPLRPNDLLKHEIARWAREQGKTAYVLGGGYGGEDGIYRYKKSFAPHGLRDFSVWRYIVNEDGYAEAMAARRTYSSVAGEDWQEFAPDFFPAYRAQS